MTFSDVFRLDNLIGHNLNPLAAAIKWLTVLLEYVIDYCNDCFIRVY